MKCKHLKNLNLRTGLNPFFAAGLGITLIKDYFVRVVDYTCTTLSSTLWRGGCVLSAKPQVSNADGDKR